MLLLYLETKPHSQTVIKHSKFESNRSYRKSHGSDLVLFFDKHSRTSANEIYQPLKVIDIHFHLEVFLEINKKVLFILL